MADAAAAKAESKNPTKTEIMLYLVIEELGGGTITRHQWGNIAEALTKAEGKVVTDNAARFRYANLRKKMQALGVKAGKNGGSGREASGSGGVSAKKAKAPATPKKKGKAGGKKQKKEETEEDEDEVMDEGGEVKAEPESDGNEDADEDEA